MNQVRIAKSRSYESQSKTSRGRCKLLPSPTNIPPHVVRFQLTYPTSPNDTARDSFLSKIDAALKPFIEDMGYDWEYSVEETRRDLWKINGMVPPMPNTKAEKEWWRLNRAVEYEKVDGGLGEGVSGRL